MAVGAVSPRDRPGAGRWAWRPISAVRVVRRGRCGSVAIALRGPRQLAAERWPLRHAGGSWAFTDANPSKIVARNVPDAAVSLMRSSMSRASATRGWFLASTFPQPDLRLCGRSGEGGGSGPRRLVFQTPC